MNGNFKLHILTMKSPKIEFRWTLVPKSKDTILFDSEGISHNWNSPKSVIIPLENWSGELSFQLNELHTSYLT